MKINVLQVERAARQLCEGFGIDFHGLPYHATYKDRRDCTHQPIIDQTEALEMAEQILFHAVMNNGIRFDAAIFKLSIAPDE